MRLGVALALAAALTGCGEKTEQWPASRAAGTSESSPAVNAASAIEENAASNALGESGNAAAAGALGSLPPADAALRFVGLWATSRENCATAPWRFTAERLSVAGGPNCTFYEVSKAAGGYDLAAQCPTKEPVHTDLIKLRFAESARAMLVESNAIKPTGLIYCGK